jgi:branched-chain amino acid transport system ATP-binding protein
VSGAGEPLLRVSGVDASYGPVQILFGLDVEVAEGEIVALLGTNGAGKSTLFRCITGLLPPSRGSIVFDGTELVGRNADEIAELGVVMMPGGRSVFPTLTVRENLQVASWMKRKDAAAVRAAEERVLAMFPRLAQRIGTMAGNLSGGEQQMLAISQALIPDPRLHLIDELSLGLAPTIVAQLIEVVRDVHATGLTIVVVEQ